MVGIFIGDTAPSKIFVGGSGVASVWAGDTKIRPSGPDKDYLCFTAEQANSTVKLNKNGSPTAVNLETSTDGQTWSDYTFGTDITLTNVGNKVYWRNKSETVTNFSTNGSNSYRFVIGGLVGASGDINFLLCKNSSTDALPGSCFYSLFLSANLTTPPKLPATALGTNSYAYMFQSCTLTTAPSLPATTLGSGCYDYMFNGCPNLETLPSLSATTLPARCYRAMFRECSKIKLSSSQTGDYQTAYRIPAEGTGSTTGSGCLDNMFTSTGGTFTGTPTINKTYYTSNTVV